MPVEPIPFQRRKNDAPSSVEEVHIVWLTAGLSCDGDSVSVTAAEQPSIEDVILGAIPGLPKVYLHNPVLAYENGDDFMKFFYQAERGEIDPFVLVVEGSIPNEQIKDEGYWAAQGTDPNTGQPITTCEWIDRLAPKALAVIGAGTCATYGGIHAMAGNPTGCMGLADYLGWNWRSKAVLISPSRIVGRGAPLRAPEPVPPAIAAAAFLPVVCERIDASMPQSVAMR